MAELIIECALNDKEMLMEFFKKADQEIDVGWYTAEAAFCTEVDSEEQYYSYLMELLEIAEMPGCPPFFAWSVSKNPWVVIHVGSFYFEFVTDSNQVPQVSIYETDNKLRQLIYDQAAEGLLYYELAKEFDIYKEMRG